MRKHHSFQMMVKMLMLMQIAMRMKSSQTMMTLWNLTMSDVLVQYQHFKIRHVLDECQGNGDFVLQSHTLVQSPVLVLLEHQIELDIF